MLRAQGFGQLSDPACNPCPPPLQEDHMGSLVITSALKADGKMSDQDSYVMFHPADRRVPYILIARGELPSLFVDVSDSCPALSFAI